MFFFLNPTFQSSWTNVANYYSKARGIYFITLPHFLWRNKTDSYQARRRSNTIMIFDEITFLFFASLITGLWCRYLNKFSISGRKKWNDKKYSCNYIYTLSITNESLTLVIAKRNNSLFLRSINICLPDLLLKIKQESFRTFSRVT